MTGSVSSVDRWVSPVTGMLSSARGGAGEWAGDDPGVCGCKLVSISFFAGGECIFHECRDGHRAYASRHRCNIAAVWGHFCEFDISLERKPAFFTGVRHAGDTHIYNNSTWFDHRGVDEFRFAESSYNDIGLQAYFPQVTCMGMADRDRAIAGMGVGAQQ